MQCLTKEFMLQYLNDCPQSRSLNLSNHNIEYIEDLEGITCRLQEVNLSNNRLSNIANLKILTHLTHLDLSCNNISNINGLENLLSLKVLLLNSNKIHTVSSLQPLRALKQLKHLTIYSNPICSIPHFSLIIKQIISKTTLLDQYSNFKTNENLYDENSFSDHKESTVQKLENENKRLKANIEALQRVLIIHESSLEKCANQNQTFDFKEWRQAFVQTLIEHETFLKKEFKNKQLLKNEINKSNQSIQKLNALKQEISQENKTLHEQINILNKMKKDNWTNVIKCKDILSNNMLSINTRFCNNQKQWDYKLQTMNDKVNIFQKQINLIQQRVYEFRHKTTSEKQNLFRQYQIKQGEMDELRAKYENEKSVKQFYGEQIISLTTQNKESNYLCQQQTEYIYKQKAEIKSQSAMIENYKLKVSDLINKFFKIKQIIQFMKNEQNDINTSIKIILQKYLNEIGALKSNIHLKHNQIICLKSFEIMEMKKIIKQQLDGISNFQFKKYHAINERIANMNLKIDNMSNEFENVMDITEKKQYVLIQQINELQLEKDQIMSRDDFKDESEELIQINTRPMPRKLQLNDDEDDGEQKQIVEKKEDTEQVNNTEKYNDDHLSKLENLLKLTKSLLDESEEEKIVKQLLEN